MQILTFASVSFFFFGIFFSSQNQKREEKREEERVEEREHRQWEVAEGDDAMETACSATRDDLRESSKPMSRRGF